LHYTSLGFTENKLLKKQDGVSLGCGFIFNKQAVVISKEAIIPNSWV